MRISGSLARMPIFNTFKSNSMRVIERNDKQLCADNMLENCHKKKLCGVCSFLWIGGGEEKITLFLRIRPKIKNLICQSFHKKLKITTYKINPLIKCRWQCRVVCRRRSSCACSSYHLDKFIRNGLSVFERGGNLLQNCILHFICVIKKWFSR